MAKTGIPALDAIIKTTSKKFGKDFSGQDWGDVDGITTGSIKLDSLLEIGGIPEGRVTEIFGWQSSGKTSLALNIIALRQKYRAANEITDKRDLIIDLEFSLTTKFIEGFGIDMNQIIWVRPDTAEEALQIAIDYPKSGAIDMVLFDSVDAAQNNKMLSRNVGENDVGGISKDMNFALRQICKIAPEHNTTYIFINQIKQNPGQMMGNPNVTTGGNALKFYAMLRLELMTNKPSPNLSGAMIMRIKLNKTKISNPVAGKAIELDFVYGKGFDPQFDLMMYAKELEMLRLGTGNKLRWTPNDEPVTICKGGAKGFRTWALEEENFNKLKDACLNWHNIPIMEQPIEEVVADDNIEEEEANAETS